MYFKSGLRGLLDTRGITGDIRGIDILIIYLNIRFLLATVFLVNTYASAFADQASLRRCEIRPI